MKGGIKRAVFEFASIVVAVVLAMGLTEWRQDVLNRQQAERSYQSILEEVRINHDYLKPDSALMAGLVRRIDDWLASDDASRDTISSFEYELNLLNQSAWEVAKLNGSMTYIDNQRLQELSVVHEFQEFYVISGREVFDELTSLMKMDKESKAYEGGMRAFRLKVGLTYNALLGYLESFATILDRTAEE